MEETPNQLTMSSVTANTFNNSSVATAAAAKLNVLIDAFLTVVLSVIHLVLDTRDWLWRCWFWSVGAWWRHWFTHSPSSEHVKRELTSLSPRPSHVALLVQEGGPQQLVVSNTIRNISFKNLVIF